MSKKLKIILQFLLPHYLLSRVMGWFGNCRCRWFKNIFIRTFVRIYHVDMSCAIDPKPESYASFNDFFSRKLRSNARPIADGPSVIVSPVDGTISQIGVIDHKHLLQAKGFHYSLATLLANDTEATNAFVGGNFATLYLAPHNYHRVHMPLTGVLQKMIYVPGELFSVNPNTVANVNNLFARNERVITLFETEIGMMAVILVGAMIVGSMETVWHGKITPPHGGDIQRWDYSDQQIKIARGEEVGLFKMGSTAIVLFPQNCMAWTPAALPGSEVNMGIKLGEIICN